MKKYFSLVLGIQNYSIKISEKRHNHSRNLFEIIRLAINFITVLLKPTSQYLLRSTYANFPKSAIF
jgi:hypothetical protein